MKKLEKSKNFLKSKTLWVNAILGVLAVLDVAGEVTGNPQAIIAGMAIANIILRLITNKPITVK
jgi:ABC-type transporter lipoprotein component MlaA